MIAFTDDEARALREEIGEITPPPLRHEILARVHARRASGERIVLPVANNTGARRHVRRVTVAVGVATMAAAALVLLLSREQRGRDGRAQAAVDQMALAPVDEACANYAPQDSLSLRRLMIDAFGVAAACGAEIEPATPVIVNPAQVVAGTFRYRGITVTDGLHTSMHDATTVRIWHTNWNGTPAIVALRFGPLITRVSVDTLTVSALDLSLLHWGSWYPTQKPIGSMRADFDSSSVTIVMKGRFDTTGTFPYANAPGRLPQEWIHYLVIPALPLTANWHGTLQIAPPIHPHVHQFFTQGWASITLRVIARETLTVAGGTFDCWKLEIGGLYGRSQMWVSTANHLVVRTRATYRVADTEFEDQTDLEHVIYTPNK